MESGKKVLAREMRRGELEFAYDILNAIRHDPLNENNLIISAHLDNTTMLDTHLEPLITSGFITTQWERSNGKYGQQPLHVITPKGAQLFKVLHETIRMLDIKLAEARSSPA